MCFVVMNGVDRRLLEAILIQWLSRIGVHIKAGEVAAGDIHADPVAFFKDVGRRVEFDRDGINFVGLHECFRLERIAEAGADDAVADVKVEAAGEIGAGRIDVDQLGGEVGIFCTRRDPEFDRQFTGDFEIFFQRFGFEDDHIVAGRQRCWMFEVPDLIAAALVPAALDEDIIAAGDVSANRRNRVGRIEQKAGGSLFCFWCFR